MKAPLNTQVSWLVEEYIHAIDPRLVETLRKKEYAVKILPHDCGLDFIKYGLSHCLSKLFPVTSTVVFHGSLGTTKKYMERSGRYTYRQFFDKDSLRTLVYYNNKALRPYLLNAQHIYLPLWQVFDMVTKGIGQPCFIRPDSPFKEFEGQIVKPGDNYEAFLTYNNLSEDKENLLTMVSPVKTLDAEARFLVTRDNIVSASYYKNDGHTFYQNIDVSADDCGFVQYVKNLLRDERIFGDLLDANGGLLVIDVARVVEDVLSDIIKDYKVIEVGSFTTASLYEGDFSSVIDTVSGIAYANDNDD